MTAFGYLCETVVIYELLHGFFVERFGLVFLQPGALELSFQDYFAFEDFATNDTFFRCALGGMVECGFQDLDLFVLVG